MNDLSDITYIEGILPKEYGADAVEIPGAAAVLESLDKAGARWGVVTSGTCALVDGWIQALKLTRPDVVVTAEDVERGKPEPQCYLLGRSRIGLDESKTNILVLEDAPSGIRAAKAAGFKVLALCTTHTPAQVRECEADWIVQDLRSISINGVVDGKIQVEIRDALGGGG